MISDTSVVCSSAYNTVATFWSLFNSRCHLALYSVMPVLHAAHTGTQWAARWWYGWIFSQLQMRSLHWWLHRRRNFTKLPIKTAWYWCITPHALQCYNSELRWFIISTHHTHTHAHALFSNMSAIQRLSLLTVVARRAHTDATAVTAADFQTWKKLPLI